MIKYIRKWSHAVSETWHKALSAQMLALQVLELPSQFCICSHRRTTATTRAAPGIHTMLPI